MIETHTQGTRDVHDNWPALGALSLGMVLLYTNTTMINVALPAISAGPLDPAAGSAGLAGLASTSGLGADTGQLEWIVSSYNLAFLSVLLPGGALGDRLGHRRLLTGGIALFAVGAVLAAAAPAVGILVVARVMMGLAASVFTPMSLALIPQIVTRGRRAAATAIWTAAGAVGAPLGPLVGGSMIDRWGWRAMFWFDIAAALLVLALCLALLPRTRAADRGPLSLPLAQLATSAAGFALITWGLINAEHAWAAPATWGPLATGAVLLVSFVLIETRARDRLTDLGLLTRRRFRLPALTLMGINFVLFGLLFVAPDYLQTVLGHDAATGGLMLMPVAGTAVVGALTASALSERGRPVRGVVLPAAMALTAVGLWLCSTTSTTGGYRPMLWGLLVAGLGLGIGQSYGIESAMRAVPDERAGAGAALLNALRQLGAVCGVALLGSLTGHRYADGVAALLGDPPDAVSTAAAQSVTAAFTAAGRLPGSAAEAVRAAASAAYVNAMDAVLAVCAVVAAVAAGLLLVLAASRAFVQSRS